MSTSAVYGEGLLEMRLQAEQELPPGARPALPLGERAEEVGQVLHAEMHQLGQGSCLGEADRKNYGTIDILHFF